MTGSTFRVNNASSIMGTMLQRSIIIPRDITFKGTLTLVDRDGTGEAELKQDQMVKVIDIEDGIVSSNKAVITDFNKNISGINDQTNNGQFIFDISGDNEEEVIDLLFKRTRGTSLNKIETFHGNHIGTLSFQPYVGTKYIDSAGININTYKRSYSDKFSGSEIIFSNSGGSDINNGKHDSLKIDARGNLNILKSQELRLNVFRDTIFSGFRPSTSTSSPGYTLELPPGKGGENQILGINKVGKNGKISLSSNHVGVITSTSIASAGTGYDSSYFPELNTNIKMTGGLLKENGTCITPVTNQTYTITSTHITSSNPAKLTINPMVIANGSKITIDTIEGTMGTELLTGNTYYVKIVESDKIELYKNKGHTIGVNTINKVSTGVGTHTITSPGCIYLSTTASTENNFYNGWTIETINPNAERIILNYDGTSKKAILSSNIPDTTILTQYKLKQGHGLSKISRENNIYKLIDTFSSIADTTTTLSTINNYYNDWTIIIEIINNGHPVIYKGFITSYDNDTKVITINWINTAPPTTNTNGTSIIIDEEICTLTNERTIPASVKITNINESSGSIHSVELIDGGSGYIPNLNNIIIDVPSQTKLQWTSITANDFTTPNSIITAGNCLSGGGNIGNPNGEIIINFDLSTHDSNGASTSTYQSKSTDKILLYNVESGESYMPDIKNFLTSIVGSGFISEENNLTGAHNLMISNSQQILTNISDNLKIYSSENKHSTHYLNIGKDDSNNIKFKGEYKTSEDLGIQSNTFIINGKGEKSIQISNPITVFIPAQTNISFIYPNQDTLVYANITDDVQVGAVDISLSENAPNPPPVTINITEMTGIPSNTTITNGAGTNTITISNETTEQIEKGEILTFTYEDQVGVETGVVNLTVPSGSTTIQLETISPNPPIITIEINPINYLNKTIIQTQSTKTNNDASIQFDIGNQSEVVNIDTNGLSVKNGTIHSISIDDGGSGYSPGDEVTVTQSPFGEKYTAQVKIILNTSGEIIDTIILYSGLGYSKLEPVKLSVSTSSGGTNADLRAHISDESYIVGQINNPDIRYNGYFENLFISGDQNFEGTLKVIDQGAVELGKPSNLDFSEDDSNFLFGYDVGRYGGIRNSDNGDNTFIGYKTGYNSTIATKYTTLCGSNAGYENKTGEMNTYIGYKAGYDGTENIESVCVGYLAGKSLTGSYNTALGTRSGPQTLETEGGDEEANTIYINNGNNNVYLGYNTQSKCGNNNLFAGSNAGNLAESNDGVFLGYNTGNNSTGDRNILIGFESGMKINNSENNVLIGYQSGYNIGDNISPTSDNIVNGEGNIMIGYKSGFHFDKISSNNIIIGSNAGFQGTTDNSHTGMLIIDTSGIIRGDNSLIYGNQNLGQQTLSFNADVTIKQTENSSGNLTVKGDINVTGSITGDLIGNASTADELNNIPKDTIVLLDADQTLTKKTFDAPVIIKPHIEADANGNLGVIHGIFKGDLEGTADEVSTLSAGGPSGSGFSTNDLPAGSADDRQYYSDSLARKAFSVQTDGAGLTYDNETGIITYTPPDSNEIRAQFSNGTGVTLDGGIIGIGQNVDKNSSPVFNQLSISGPLSIIDGQENVLQEFTQDGLIGDLTTNNGHVKIIDNGLYLNNAGLYLNNINIVPDIVLRDKSQTLKYKTLVSPTINAPVINIIYCRGGGAPGGTLKIYGKLQCESTDGIDCKRLNIPSTRDIKLGGTSNTYLGYNSAIGSNSSAQRNAYFGYQTGRYSTSGNHNTYIGSEAGFYTTSGAVNTFVGNRAGYTNQTGRNNCSLGHYAGYYVKGNSNLMLGYNAGPTGSSSASYYLYIDPITRRGSDSMIYGYAYGGSSGRSLHFNSNVTVKHRIWASSFHLLSDISLKKNVIDIGGNITDKLNLLRPVNYTLKSNNNKDVGFIAQEVKKIFPLLVNKSIRGPLSIDYPKLTTYLVKGIQESNKTINEIKNKLNEEKEKREQMEAFFKKEIENLRKELIYLYTNPAIPEETIKTL